MELAITLTLLEYSNETSVYKSNNVVVCCVGCIASIISLFLMIEKLKCRKVHTL